MTHSPRNTSLLSNRSPSLRRYSLSDIGFVSPLKREKSKHYTVSGNHSFSELSHKFTHIDSKSPGFATRIVQYNEEKEKSLPISHSKYDKPGIFPVVHFFKKDLPLFHKSSRVNGRMNPSEMSKYNSPEQNRMLLESIIQTSPRNKSVSSDNKDVNTKSVLDALKEISRKRIHSNEEEFVFNEDGKRTCMNYSPGNNQRKKIKFNSSQTDETIKIYQSKSQSLDELKASFSSMDGQLVKKFKMDVKPKESPAPLVKSPSPVKSVNVETQTVTENITVEKPVIQNEIPKESENKKNLSPQNKTKTLPVKVFDETPLETMRKNRLVALMGSSTEEKTKEVQDLNQTITKNENSPTSDNKPLVSILSGPVKDPNKTNKHVTFNIPDHSNSSNSTDFANSANSTPVSNNIFNNTNLQRPYIVTQTSAALVTPIVSSNVADTSSFKKAEVIMKDSNESLTPSTNVSESKSQNIATPFKLTTTTSEQTTTSITPVLNVGFNSVSKSEESKVDNSVKELFNVSQTPTFEKKNSPPITTETTTTTQQPGGFKFTFSSSTPLPMSFGQTPVSTNVNSDKTVLFKPTQANENLNSSNSIVTTPSTVTTTTNSFGNFTLPKFAGFGTLQGSNTGSSFNFGTNQVQPVTTAAVTSPNFAIATNDKPQQTFLNPSNMNESKSSTTSGVSTFLTSSNLTSKPAPFSFTPTFKSTSSGMFDSLTKNTLPNATPGPVTSTSITTVNGNTFGTTGTIFSRPSNILTSGQPTTTPQTFSNELSFNKPPVSFPSSNLTFGSMFNTSTSATSTNSTSPFGVVSFTTNTSAFSGNNPQFNFKSDTAPKRSFGQEMTPQFGTTTTASVFPGNNTQTNAFASAATTSNNIFGNVTNFGSGGFGITQNSGINPNTEINQNSGFNSTPNNQFKSNSGQVFGGLFGAVTTASSFGSTGSFQTNSSFPSNFNENPSFEKPRPAFEAPPFQNTQNPFGSSSFSANPPTTQSDVFTFGVNANKPAVFSFGGSEPPKPTFNFGSTDSNPINFNVGNKSLGGPFAPAPTPQFNVPGGTPGMFNIGTGSTTPSRSRTQLKAKRRT